MLHCGSADSRYWAATCLTRLLAVPPPAPVPTEGHSPAATSPLSEVRRHCRNHALLSCLRVSLRVWAHGGGGGGGTVRRFNPPQRFLQWPQYNTTEKQ